jgi:hypothetical protein
VIFGKKGQAEDAHIAQRNRMITYKRVFGTPEGKEVLMDLMNRNFILNGHKGDPHSEGRRACVLDIIYECKIDVAQFDSMMKENE